MSSDLRFVSNIFMFSRNIITLTFEIPVVKCSHGIQVKWSPYRDTGVTDHALVSVI